MNFFKIQYKFNFSMQFAPLIISFHHVRESHPRLVWAAMVGSKFRFIVSVYRNVKPIMFHGLATSAYMKGYGRDTWL